MTAPRITQGITRRAALGAGLAFTSAAFTSAACAGRLGAQGPDMLRPAAAPAFDALLVDETVALPDRLAAFVAMNRQNLPVLAIRLDAAGFAGMAATLRASHALVGISSGATLFCLERIAWDHGFRLTRRHHRCVADLDDMACREDVLTFLGGSHAARSLTRTYRPSRADGMLHVWAMQKTGRPHLHQMRREA